MHVQIGSNDVSTSSRTALQNSKAAVRAANNTALFVTNAPAGSDLQVCLISGL